MIRFLKLFSEIVQSCSILLFLLLPFISVAQPEPLQQLVGKYPVGFSQLQQTLPVKNRESVTCTVDVWYPVASPGSERFTYKEYVLSHPDSTEERTLRSMRQTFQTFFGNTTDSAWDALLSQKTLAYKNLPLPKGEFPLILGMLRPFSTTNTCELLASHGYVIAMISQVDDFPPSDSSTWNPQMRTELALYDGVIDWLSKDTIIDRTKVGLLGFSGSGFSQFLYAMQSPNPKGIALLESGLYAEDLFSAVKHSGLYKPTHLTIPFLYFHNWYVDAKNPCRSEFNKLGGNKKSKILYVDSTMHHWDYASEGFLSSAYLGNRKPDIATRQLKNYLNVNARLIDFFNAYVRKQKSNLTKKVPAGSKVI